MVEVQVQITDMNGDLVEQGAAQAEDGGWFYLATASVPRGQTVSIKAIAKDRPGNTGTNSCLAYAS